jgi:hypothetical protein
MSAWTPELKQTVIDRYLAENPTGDTSTEIIKDLAEEFEQSPNGVRMILVQAEVYVKKEAAAGTSKTATVKKDGDAPKRVSKESSIAALVAAINAAGADVDSEIVDKLTGKAAIYFTNVLAAIAAK